MAPYCTQTAELLALAGGDATKELEARNAGAHEIDEAFGAGGYTVPIDTAALTAGDAKDRLLARLAFANRAIAGFRLSSPVEGKRGPSDKTKKDYEDVRRWLDRVALGGVAIAILPRVSGIGLLVTGDTDWGFTTDLHDLAHASLEN